MRRCDTVLAGRLSTGAVWAVGLGPAFFSSVVWDRSLTPLPGGVPGWTVTAVQPSPAAWRLQAGELYTVATLALLVGVLVAAWGRPRTSAKPAGGLLVAACIGMYAGPLLSTVFGGHGGAGDWRLYFPPLVVAALYAAPPIEADALLRQLRMMLRVYTWGSLCALAVAPDWALATSEIVNFRLPTLGSSRLVGLTNHPILLGILATAALAMELAPMHRSRLWPVHSAAAAAVLVVAQSRTAWMAAPFALLLLYRRRPGNRVPPLLGRSLVLSVAACLAVLVPTVTDRLGRIMEDREIASLHGRTDVWNLAMSAFRSDPMWGYGPTLFTDRSSPVQGAFAHAHSQLHQTLSTSGLVGLLGLLAFAAALVVTAARTGQVSGGLSWALVVITVATCTTEAPLRGLEFSPYVVLVQVELALLLAWSRSVAAAPGPAAAQLLGPPAGSGRSSRRAVNSSPAAG